MQRSFLSGSAIAAVLATPLAAQNWVELFPTSSPPGVSGHGMAYDFLNDTTVLFGGGAASGRIDQTWLFDGVDWMQATPAVSPPPRAGHPLAYDLGRGRVVLFGGIGVPTGSLNDTWEWDGTNWQQMSPTNVPPARLSHPLVYHPGRGTCVMHGGNSLGAGTLTDTWEWNGTNWVSIPTTMFPSPLRFAADMAYDPNGGGIVYFGGYIGGVGQSDTWYFDNTTSDWAPLVTATTPPGRYDHTMVTDIIRNRVVMFGGTAATDTWEFDGTDWIQQTPANLPPARYDDYLVYDLVRGQTVMFGGDQRNDTWVYQTPPQPGFAAAIPYGEGCVEANATIYELFPANTFDLSNTTLQFVPTATGYAVFPSAPAWYTPTSASLGLGDETVSAALPLGFTLNYPGGSTNAVYVSANGFVVAQPGSPAQCCNGNAGLLTAGLARWSPCWMDLNPGAGGTTHFDVDPVSGTAYVTFDNVPEYAQTTTVTFQVAFFTSGAVEMRFQNCTNANHTALVGWSPGGGVRDPGTIDLSAITTPVVTAPDLTALWHRTDLRPVLGNTVALITGTIPASALFGATVLGLTKYDPGIDLSSFGMPSCYQFVSNDAAQLAIPSGGRAITNFNVPVSTAFVGVQVKSQGAAFVPGINPTGAITSNGVELTIDAN